MALITRTQFTHLWETDISVQPYPWTVPTLVELRRRDIPIVVLSDAWPSLRRWFAELGLSPFVQAMVISAEEGITKPDARVFNKARGLLGPHFDEVIFVDDYPGHVQAASALGMRAFWLRPQDEVRGASVTELTDLRQLLDRL
jgi:putative hydrolase of the HAD superfamily